MIKPSTLLPTLYTRYVECAGHHVLGDRRLPDAPQRAAEEWPGIAQGQGSLPTRAIATDRVRVRHHPVH